MAEVKKVATRVGYGEALVELGSERDDFLVLDADLAAEYKVMASPTILFFIFLLLRLSYNHLQGRR